MIPLAFGTADAAPSWVRFTIAFVAILHALLCGRVVGMRLWRWWRHDDPPGHPERVPTAAMIAYGIICVHIARVLLQRLPGGQPLQWLGIATYAVALVFGSIAFTQIVVLKRRAER